MINLFPYPWELGQKPYLVNEIGVEWYLNKDLTKYVHQDEWLVGGGKHPGLKDYAAFTVRKKDEISYVVIGKNQFILASADNEIAISDKIKRYKVLFGFMSVEERMKFEDDLKQEFTLQTFLHS